MDSDVDVFYALLSYLKHLERKLTNLSEINKCTKYYQNSSIKRIYF